MEELLTFDDVLIVPKFSEISSRKDVGLDTTLFKSKTSLPVISANMDTITEDNMTQAMLQYGAQACLHRFCTIDRNVEMFKNSTGHGKPMVSVGLGKGELERAEALVDAGADILVIDVAHGANIEVVKQVNELRTLFNNKCAIIAGNFASVESVVEFLYHTHNRIDGIKIGVGAGAACTSRIKTGCGYPQFAAVRVICAFLAGKNIMSIADGGMKNPGDIAKAIGAGANLVMLGSMLSGTEETPGSVYYKVGGNEYIEADERNKSLDDPKNWANGKALKFKKYRGSASQESYVKQNKEASWRTAEGESFYVPYKGPVRDVLQDIEGGLRSALSYTGSHNIVEFRQNCEFVRITNAGVKEGVAHGKS